MAAEGSRSTGPLFLTTLNEGHSMLRQLRTLYGCSLHATDGQIGYLRDFYFDVRTWKVRYAVVSLADWDTGCKVLLSPEDFGINPFEQAPYPIHPGQLRVTLSRKQIEACTPADQHKPLSLQHDYGYCRIQGWPSQWMETGGRRDSLSQETPLPADFHARLHYGYPGHHDHALLNTLALDGYQVRAADGPVGTVCDFAVDDEYWAIKELILETGRWFSGREIPVLTRDIDHLSHDDAVVFVSLTRQEVLRTHPHEVAHAG